MNRFAFLLLGVLLMGADTAGPKPFELSQHLMGTEFEIKIFDGQFSQGQLLRISQGAFEVVQKLEEGLSSFKDTSLIAEANRLPVGEEITLDADAFYVLQKAQEISAESDGAFDVTVWPLKKLWMAAKEKSEPPTADAIHEALTRVGYRGLELDAGRKTLTIRSLGVQVDLGGVAKGYAIDQAARYLADQGVRSAMISGGGNMRFIGSPAEPRGWRVGVDHPRLVDHRALVVELPEARAVSTSGDYEDFFIYRGRRYSHIFDPRTGQPADTRVASVTVIAKDGTLADALSTAFFVLGPERGFALVERYGQEDAAAICIEETPEGELILSSSENIQRLLRDIQL